MKRIRIELAMNERDARAAAAELRGLGFEVEGPESSRTVQVFETTDGRQNNVLFYRDAKDGEVWTVVGRMN